MWDTIGKSILEGISDGLNRAKESGERRIRFELFRLERRIIRSILFTGFVLISCLLISLGLIFLIDQYLRIGLGISSLIVGIIVLLIGLIFKSV